MASLLTDADKLSFKNSIIDLFDTFSRNVVIHKEPKKVIEKINPTAPPLPGYGGDSSPENVTYITESQTFKAMVRYSNKQEVETDNFAGTKIPMGMVAIKVQSDARAYINNGTTEKIVLDGKSFKLASNDAVKDHFGYALYVYIIEEIK
tara:strand:- start:1112 stop:1558 length:447 start_codon:yes stop_codon:yes gene_type:complete